MVTQVAWMMDSLNCPAGIGVQRKEPNDSRPIKYSAHTHTGLYTSTEACPRRGPFASCACALVAASSLRACIKFQKLNVNIPHTAHNPNRNIQWDGMEMKAHEPSIASRGHAGTGVRRKMCAGMSARAHCDNVIGDNRRRCEKRRERQRG